MERVDFIKDSADITKIKQFVIPELESLYTRNKKFGDLCHDDYYRGFANGIETALRKINEVISND